MYLHSVVELELSGHISTAGVLVWLEKGESRESSEGGGRVSRSVLLRWKTYTWTWTFFFKELTCCSFGRWLPTPQPCTMAPEVDWAFLTNANHDERFFPPQQPWSESGPLNKNNSRTNLLQDFGLGSFLFLTK